jgi:hypothetical protein
MNLLAITAAILALPCVVLSAPNSSEVRHGCPFTREDCLMLRALLAREGNTEAFTTKFAECRFQPDNLEDYQLIVSALQSVIISDRMDLYNFLIERVKLVNDEWRDRLFTNLLVHALASDKMDFFQHFWYQHNKICSLDAFYGKALSDKNLEQVKQLVSSNPERAAELIPSNMYGMKAETALRAIDLAYHCSLLSEKAAAKFKPTEHMLALLGRYKLNDAEMVRVASSLCDAGAVVSQETFDVLDAQHPTFALPCTREALENIQAFQDPVKETETD